jgi:hypothetical protein
MNIFSETKSKSSFINLERKPFIKPLTLHSQDRKMELYKIAQENQFLLKRINEKTSFYNTKKSLDDYKKSMNYKKNICVFPVIDFNNTNNRFHDIKMKTFNISARNFEDEEIGESTERKVFYNKNFLVRDLSNCSVKFYVEDKKFIISVTPLTKNEISYFISFDSIEGKLI